MNPCLNNEGYPTDEFLEYIKTYDLVKGNVFDFIEELRQGWWMDDWGFKLTKVYKINGWE